MNAPTSFSPDHVRDAPSEHEDGWLEGVARHVSADGCQLVVTGEAPSAGRRLSFPIGAGETMTGTIRWVLGSRVGFVFDRQVDAATAVELSAYLTQLRRLELLPLAREAEL